MNARILISWAILLASCTSQGQVPTPPRWDNYVIVRKLKEDLPTKEAEIGQFLSSRFINNPETDAFGTLTTAQWKEWLPWFEEGLIAKAKKAALDAESLQHCLIAVSNRLEKLPHLPVGAYLASQGDVAVWIIVIKWEFSGPEAKKRPAQPMVHTQVLAFDSRKRTIIGFATCN